MQTSTQMFTAGLFIIQIHETVQMAFNVLTVKETSKTSTSIKWIIPKNRKKNSLDNLKYPRNYASEKSQSQNAYLI